jgi:hypothetical protein
MKHCNAKNDNNYKKLRRYLSDIKIFLIQESKGLKIHDSTGGNTYVKVK